MSQTLNLNSVSPPSGKFNNTPAAFWFLPQELSGLHACCYVDFQWLLMRLQWWSPGNFVQQNPGCCKASLWYKHSRNAVQSAANLKQQTQWLLSHAKTGEARGQQQKPVSSVQLLSRVQLCSPIDCSTPVFPVHHQLPELAQTHVI